jgi:hypothetical protein
MQKATLTWLYIGLISFSIVMGLMIGSSNSPVTGVLISSIFCIGVAAAGMILSRDKKGEQHAAFSASQVGKSLTLFSASILLGAYLGTIYRTTEKPNGKHFIWEGNQIPSSTYEALDWIMVEEILSRRGYDEQQIRSIYAIRVREMEDTSSKEPYSGSSYSYQTPYSKILLQNEESQKSRGLASE